MSSLRQTFADLLSISLFIIDLLIFIKFYSYSCSQFAFGAWREAVLANLASTTSEFANLSLSSLIGLSNLVGEDLNSFI